MIEPPELNISNISPPAAPTVEVVCAMDPYKKIRVGLNPDGTLTRYTNIPTVPPTGDRPLPGSDYPALSKDVPLNTAHNTWIRIFTPNNQSSTSTSKKLPVILYFHGGGFVLYSAASVIFHNSCAQMSASLPALILSVEYRLAPEHRLPAAYEDAVDALLWVRDQARCRDPEAADPWMKARADFSQCFLMGSSSGGNVVYNLGLRTLQLDLKPLNLAGLILDQPFFGGEEKTESEARMENDRIVPLPVAHLLWELSLPVGANRDHEYSKPRKLEGKGKGLPRCLVMGYVGDPLVDRQRAVAAMLEEEGVSVVARLEKEGFHAIEIFDSEKAEAMVAEVRSFIYNGDGNATVTSGTRVAL